MSRVNILKRVKIGARWKLLSIPRNDKGNPNWAALPEGRYFIEWYLGGKRRREFGGTTVAQALESQKRKRHELEGRHLGLAQLLSGPLGRRMRGDIEVQDPSAVVSQHQEHV